MKMDKIGKYPQLTWLASTAIHVPTLGDDAPSFVVVIRWAGGQVQVGTRKARLRSGILLPLPQRKC